MPHLRCSVREWPTLTRVVFYEEAIFDAAAHHACLHLPPMVAQDQIRVKPGTGMTKRVAKEWVRERQSERETETETETLGVF